ncbi:Dabb family protein [Pseudonocardia sp. KRD291]|uniref:Dabb family protein n=1 Tax=Pseudonocardia sp. KRD291 TaxID=2792007 RepID=UPI001C49E5EC|nr:Dabb family protein [Pseudonocardia sp. KRD291]MBW0102650.1 Dabb family protein [Pseudonocardia sp. KRD291]
MLVHCLTLRFTSTATDAEIEAFRSALAALPDELDFPVHIRQGRDLGERPTNADYGVVAEFGSAEDFRTYLAHPAHLALPRSHVESTQSVQFELDGSSSAPSCGARIGVPPGR